jgi:hypothetical protein
LGTSFRLTSPPTITKQEVRKLLEEYGDKRKARELLENL